MAAGVANSLCSMATATREATAEEVDAIQRRIDAVKAEKKPNLAEIKQLETDIIIKTPRPTMRRSTIN
jgi:hypothetical protein